VASTAASVASNVTEKIRERSGSILRPRSSSFTENAAKKEAAGNYCDQPYHEKVIFFKMAL
jgi:hypothetical protein